MKDNYRAGNYRIGLSRVIPSSRKKRKKNNFKWPIRTKTNSIVVSYAPKQLEERPYLTIGFSIFFLQVAVKRLRD